MNCSFNRDGFLDSFDNVFLQSIHIGSWLFDGASIVTNLRYSTVYCLHYFFESISSPHSTITPEVNQNPMAITGFSLKSGTVAQRHSIE